MSSAAASWDSRACITRRRKPERKPEHTGTGTASYARSREAPHPAAERRGVLALGLARSWEEAHTASPFKSESKTHRVAGQKLNFKPVHAASQRLPQPGYGADTGFGERRNVAGRGRRN